MGFNEFKDLWQALNGWRGTFASFDRDQSGTIEGHELQQAINSMGKSKLKLSYDFDNSQVSTGALQHVFLAWVIPTFPTNPKEVLYMYKSV